MDFYRLDSLYDSIEPGVIDQDMIKEAIEEQGPQNEAGRLFKEQGIDYKKVQCLRLEFKNILKIDCLWMLTSLTKLQLDNNIIEKINGLDNLVNLKVLDLSFNNIEVINGLDKLTQLEQLSIYENRISKLKNMDALEKLVILCAGNNRLDDYDNIVYLRRFQDLRALSFAGNPFCGKKDFNSFVISTLPSIVYFEYKMVDKDAREKAIDLRRFHLSQLELEEEKIQQDKEIHKQKKIEKELHKEAFVENLGEDELFEEMFKEDREGRALAKMPESEIIYSEFKTQFTKITREVFEFGLNQMELRKQEEANFYKCINDAKQSTNEQGQKLILDFLDLRSSVVSELHLVLESQEGEEPIQMSQDTRDRFIFGCATLREKLMTLELHLVDQIEDTIREFERNLTELRTKVIEYVQAQFAFCREFQTQYNERMTDVAIKVLAQKDKIEGELKISSDTTLTSIFQEKESVSNALTASNDAHIQAIDLREDEFLSRSKSWLDNLINDESQKECLRNRDAVTEIHHLIDTYREEFEDLNLLMNANASENALGAM